MDTRSNRPSLDALRHLPVGEVIALPPEHLALLQSDAREALDAAKRTLDWIEGAIALRYSASSPPMSACRARPTRPPSRCSGRPASARRRS
jgi:phage terminase large subunit-like protein